MVILSVLVRSGWSRLLLLPLPLLGFLVLVVGESGREN